MKNMTLMGSALLALLAFPALGAPMKGEVSYKKDVVPILHDYCLSCHQPGGKGYEKSGLDMRTYDSLMKGTFLDQDAVRDERRPGQGQDRGPEKVGGPRRQKQLSAVNDELKAIRNVVCLQN